MVVIAANLWTSKAVLNDGSLRPIIFMNDDEGDMTEDPRECAAFVVQVSDDLFISCLANDFETKIVIH